VLRMLLFLQKQFKKKVFNIQESLRKNLTNLIIYDTSKKNLTFVKKELTEYKEILFANNNFLS